MKWLNAFTYVMDHWSPWKSLRWIHEGKNDLTKPEKGMVSEILLSGRSKMVSNPRDKVYALYGILEAYGVDLPHPDYDTSVERVFEQVTTAVMKYDKSISILKHACSSLLPLSWVPDFRFQKMDQFPPGRFAASPRSRPVFRFANSELHVLGHSKIHIIATRLDPLPQNDLRDHSSPSLLNKYAGFDKDSEFLSLLNRVRVIQTFRDWAARVLDVDTHQISPRDWAERTKGRKAAKASRLKEFGTALALGSQDSGLQQGIFTWLSYILAGIDDICPLLKETEKDRNHYGIHSAEHPDFLGWISYWLFNEPVVGRTHNYICQLLEGRIMIVTDRGYMGFTSPLAEPGYNIVILSGLDVPMVVRATHQKSKYKLIAPIYLQDAMDGELAMMPEWKMYTIV